MRRLILVLALATLLVPDAHADGLPVLGVDVGSSGVTLPTGTVRYVTVPVGISTLVERVQRNGGRLLGSAYVPGTFTIPAVAYDRTPGGLSGDGRTLVLIEPRVGFPRAETQLLVLDAHTLAIRTLVKLPGDFSFDAVSPAGTHIFLIQYTSKVDPTRYRVRSFDVADRRLDPRLVVDPHDRSEAMRGNPLSRATSADGRFAYTLYDGNGKPFVHALDTREQTARCIDVALPAGLNFSTLRLAMADGGHNVVVRSGARSLVSIDTASLAVVPPRVATPSRLPFVLGAALLAAVALLLAARRRGARSRRAPRAAAPAA